MLGDATVLITSLSSPAVMVILAVHLLWVPFLKLLKTSQKPGLPLDSKAVQSCTAKLRRSGHS